MSDNPTKLTYDEALALIERTPLAPTRTVPSDDDIAARAEARLIEGFRDPANRHIARRLVGLEIAQFRIDFQNAELGIPRDKAQAERWRRLGLLP